MSTAEALRRINLLLTDVQLRAKVWAQDADPNHITGQDARRGDRHHRLTVANERESHFPFGLLALPFAVCSQKRCKQQ